jgi:hypothetical protein
MRRQRNGNSEPVIDTPNRGFEDSLLRQREPTSDSEPRGIAPSRGSSYSSSTTPPVGSRCIRHASHSHELHYFASSSQAYVSPSDSTRQSFSISCDVCHRGMTSGFHCYEHTSCRFDICTVCVDGIDSAPSRPSFRRSDANPPVAPVLRADHDEHPSSRIRPSWIPSGSITSASARRRRTYYNSPPTFSSTHRHMMYECDDFLFLGVEMVRCDGCNANVDAGYHCGSCNHDLCYNCMRSSRDIQRSENASTRPRMPVTDIPNGASSAGSQSTCHPHTLHEFDDVSEAYTNSFSWQPSCRRCSTSISRGYHCYCPSSSSMIPGSDAQQCRYDLCHTCMSNTRVIPVPPPVEATVPTTTAVSSADVREMQTVTMYTTADTDVRTLVNMRSSRLSRVHFYITPEAIPTRSSDPLRFSSPPHQRIIRCEVAVGRYRTTTRGTTSYEELTTTSRNEGYDSLRIRHSRGRPDSYHVFQSEQVLSMEQIDSHHHFSNFRDDMTTNDRVAMISAQ